ncbi:MAG: DUF7681 family protein, partial [Plesiomonas sp.]
RKITDLRELSEEEYFAMSSIHDLSNHVDALISAMEEIEGIDKRWLSIAKTDLQKGFMSAVRSIAKPESF